MGYPTWLAGEKITATKLNALVISAYKTADESVTSSTTLQNDNELFVSAAANAIYLVDVYIVYDAATGGDLKFDFTTPSGSVMRWSPRGLQAGATSAANESVNFQSRTGVEETTIGGVGGAAVARVGGSISVSTTAGTLQLRFAQGTSSGTATTIRLGSTMSLTRIG